MANPPIEWLEDSQQQMPASKHEDEEPAGHTLADALEAHSIAEISSTTTKKSDSRSLSLSHPVDDLPRLAEDEKLMGENNYQFWSIIVEHYARKLGLDHHLHAEHGSHSDADQRAVTLITQNCQHAIQKPLQAQRSAHSTWKYLKSRYSIGLWSEYAAAREKLRTLDYTLFASLTEFEAAFTSIQSACEDYGCPAHEPELICVLIRAISSSYKELADTFSASMADPKSPSVKKTLEHMFFELKSASPKPPGATLKPPKDTPKPPEITPTSNISSITSTAASSQDTDDWTGTPEPVSLKHSGWGENSSHSQYSQPWRMCKICYLSHTSTCFFLRPQLAPKWWQERNKKRLEVYKKTGVAPPPDNVQSLDGNADSWRSSIVSPSLVADKEINLLEFYLTCSDPSSSKNFLWLDSCASSHVVNTMDFFIDYTDAVQHALVGFGGQQYESRGKGTIEFTTSYGFTRIEDVYYCPESKYSIIGLYTFWDKLESIGVETGSAGKIMVLKGKDFVLPTQLNDHNKLTRILTSAPWFAVESR